MKVINREVEMICLFAAGAPDPIRLRLSDEDGKQRVIKIDKVIKRDFEKLAGNRMFVFTCQTLINGELKIIIIKYELDSCKWFIYKI